MNIKVSDTFNKELPADPNRSNSPRQVKQACFSYVAPRTPSLPRLVHASGAVASLLDLQESDIQSEEYRNI